MFFKISRAVRGKVVFQGARVVIEGALVFKTVVFAPPSLCPKTTAEGLSGGKKEEK
jgi:hypothetical protein